jgi:DNA invertase Pin-like site-specific DNA recombinase
MTQQCKSKNERSAIGYVRVSHPDQVAEGISLDAQATRIHAYCTMRGLVCTETVVDPAVSGHTRLSERAGGQQLLAALAAGTVQHVVILKLDRLFRNTMDCLTHIETWTHQGVGLHILDMSGNALDTRSAVGKMFLTMAAGFAEMERNLIAERTRLAFARKRERGERVSARLPYGVELAADGKTLRPSPRDKQLIARIKRLHRGGMHVRQIATKMTAEGYRSRSGASVSKSTVARLLRG